MTYATRTRNAPIVRSANAPEGIVEGYASVFGTEYRIGPRVRERVERGAFAASLAARGGVVPLFLGHDWSQPIGAAFASEDAHGLRVRAEFFLDDGHAKSVWRAMDARALREWSIGFIPEIIEVESRDDGTELESVTQADLLEISVVVKGANPDTATLAVRAARPVRVPAAILRRLHEPAVRSLVRSLKMRGRL